MVSIENGGFVSGEFLQEDQTWVDKILSDFSASIDKLRESRIKLEEAILKRKATSS